MAKRRATIVLLAASVVLLASFAAFGQDFDGCPPEGKGGDSALNRLKNRVQVRSTFEAMEFEELAELPIPNGIGKKHRSEWPAAILKTVGTQENRAVQVVGYLLKVKLEGPEGTNCGSNVQRDRDFHLWLANSADDDRSDSVVVEISPRFRAQHSSWSLTNLNRLVKQRAQVRISGWLMLDQEHPEQLGKTRATLWEIHPILRIEVWSGGQWRELQ